ncbi:MAG: ATP-binding protein [Kiritimatiellae bacterium]|nr:ATP-binding protein [Kiritimatiellia bacterium]
MERKIYKRLLQWKRTEAGRCALLLEGARRVGKSYIVEAFAKKEYKRHLVIDFAKAGRGIKALFEEKLGDLDEFFLLLEARTGVALERGESLVVFDEVQRFPRAREAIKYLVQDGRFHYIETGSLVSIKKNVENIVVPSEELRLQLHPMDFEEFLRAVGREGTMALVRKRFGEGMPMGQTDHRMAMELFRQYLVVGGMPQAVAAFAEEKRLEEAEFAKKLILDLYSEDIGKFAGRLKEKVRAIWRAIPGELGLHDKRFSPGAAGRNVRMRELEAPFEWLREAMIVNLATNTTDPNVGFKWTEDRSDVKCYMADTGLLASMAFSDGGRSGPEVLWRILTGKIELNKGMLMENAVAQMLRAAGRELHFHKTPVRGPPDERMEIDFLLAKSGISRRHNVIPVEVKSAKDYTTVSLDRFRKKYPGYAATPVVLHPGDMKRADGIVYLPLYMAPLLAESDGKAKQ